MLDLTYCIMMAMMNYTISHSQFPQTASGCMMPTDLPWMSEPSVGTNLIHGEKCVISRNVSENMPNFTENSRK